MRDGAKDDDLLERWLGCHRVADPLARWREADGNRALPLAFTVIASDPQAFFRLGDKVAAKLAKQAVEVVEHLEAVQALRPDTVTAVRTVRTRIETWQRQVSFRMSRKFELATRDDDEREAEILAKAQTLAEKLKLAIAEFPHYSPTLAPALFAYALSRGARGLIRLPPPADLVVAMATARLAAKRWRAMDMAGDDYAGEGSREECVKAIGIVQEWAAETVQNPLIADLDNEVAAAEDRAAGFAADAATCVEIAALSPGGVGAPSFRAWEDAEEYHSYGAVGLKRGYLQMMDLDRAQVSASAAARLAEAAVADPTLRLPDLPDPVSPRTVLATARSSLSGGILPRRSDAQSSHVHARSPAP